MATRRISMQDIRAGWAEWLPDTEIVNDAGKVIAYIPPPIKAMPISWRERLARWLFHLGEHIDPLLGITTDDDEGIHDWCVPEKGLHGSQCTVPETIRTSEHQPGITTEDTE